MVPSARLLARRQLFRRRQLHRRPPHLRLELVQQGGGPSACCARASMHEPRPAVLGISGCSVARWPPPGPPLEGALPTRRRLPSAWLGVEPVQIEKKDYYHVFKLAGFVGFDGDFK